MQQRKSILLSAAVSAAIFSPLLLVSSAHGAETLEEAFREGTTYFDFRSRYEGVDQDGARRDANALTLRSRVGFSTAPVKGLSGLIEFEDSRDLFGVNDYSVPATGYRPGKYPVIADPETTELDQAYLQYQNDGLTLRGGRQVIVLDNSRFVGDVGWRQDRQTFDAVGGQWQYEMLSLSYQYIDQRNRIFSDDADVDSSDHLIHAAYELADIGKLVGYGYLLENDDIHDDSLDTYGLSFSGEHGDDLKLTYALEYAHQSADGAFDDYDADYYAVNLGVKFDVVSVSFGYELLGSDDGEYGFSTPLATLHKFNGWADMFLSTPAEGLADASLTVKAALGPGNLTVAYHDFDTDESSQTLDDLGSEVDVAYVMKFAKHYQVGVKYANFDADDYKSDTQKWWLWLSAAF